jgi:hypothetical protein
MTVIKESWVWDEEGPEWRCGGQRSWCWTVSESRSKVYPWLGESELKQRLSVLIPGDN